jgi:hypothetical protein
MEVLFGYRCLTSQIYPLKANLPLQESFLFSWELWSVEYHFFYFTDRMDECSFKKCKFFFM